MSAMQRYKATRSQVIESYIRYAVNSLREALPDVAAGFIWMGAILILIPALMAAF